MGQTLDLLEQLIKQKKPAYAVTANLNYAMLCSQNTRLAEFTKKAALVLCDGKPIQWRSRWNQTKLPERVAGADLIYKLAERCAAKKFRVYFYGAAEGVAEQAAAELKQMYPQLIVAGVQCPPFHASSSEEVRSQIARIKQAKPDVLLVALGQPKGEFWIEDHLQELGVPLSIQLGASFDFVAGTSRRAPKFVQKIGLEWLFRTISDPKRLAPRYFKNLIFLANAIRQDMIDALT
jgi:N-acetylglucosaminyldiphosphoundecaprenol N-acetyl-beta-D-mannosaminyltransferase